MRHFGIFGQGEEATRRVAHDLGGEVGDPFIDQAAASQYGPIRAELERQGGLIGPYDLMIAAHTLALDATLVTDNVRKFSRVTGLRLENWLE